jgi:cytochrome c peroxidase
VDPQHDFRASVARGATIFASKQFLVTDSTGINDTGFGNPVRNSCAFCHNMLHAGLAVAPGQVDLGTTNVPHANPQPDLPLFRLTCRSDALAHPFLGRVIYTHDPGYALTTGKCLDIGKITAQSIRGISGRAPYFSNGSAKTLADVVDFYNRRYDIKLTDQEKLDLQHLLEVL